MRGFGILLLLLGLASFILRQFDYELRILSWADDYEPWLSLGVAALGLLLIVISMVRGRGRVEA